MGFSELRIFESVEELRAKAYAYDFYFNFKRKKKWV
jgi:hypothetical protein